MISFCASGLLCLIALHRLVFACLFPILTVCSATVCHFVATIGTGMQAGVVELAFSNGVSVWATLISTRLVLLAVLTLLLSILVVLYRWKFVYVSRNSMLVGIALCLCIIFLPIRLSGRIRMAVAMRVPYSLYYSVADYLKNRVSIAEKRTTYDHTPVKKHGNAPDVYFIIGESLRADHLPLNGYARNTMPLLSLDTSVVSFPYIYSEAFYTHLSLPVLLTDNDSLSRERADTEQSFITLFKNAGYRTAWFANQDFSRTYAPFAREADTIVHCNRMKTVYTFSKYLDADILPLFEHWANERNDTIPRLAVIHTIGSHWWYKSHYPDHASGNFTPDIESNDIGSLSQEQMVNAYDNTILETDRFLAGFIGKIKNRNAVLIYISDHGENLGDQGEYLHASGYEPTHRPACLVWYSAPYARNFPDKIRALKNNRNKNAATDAMFHTVIDAAQLKTDAFNPERSLFHDSPKN
ncbi:MAG: phosphoethanolamine transferase [Bacteroides sp.]|nr:phosphoethanolamine transferase [Bacteroides sp.]